MERSHSCSSVDDNCGIGEHNNHNNINNNNFNNAQSNNNNNNNTTNAHSPYNLRKAIELRQMRLQRQQREQQLSPLQQHYQQQQPQHTGSDNDKLHSTPTHQRIHHRRKRLQRQVSTELPDDVDYAYAADLEEEDEEEEDYDERDPDNENDNDERLAHAYHLPAFGAKQLPQFQQSIAQFNGQPSSLPNCYTTCAATYRTTHQLKHEESFDSTSTTTTTTTNSTNNNNSNMTDSATSPISPATRRHNFAMLKRDNSTQSESSSRYSSVDSLLEARKPDPEAILINLGFGPVGSEDILSRIPKRFLKPSQVRGIDTEAFVRRLQLASNLADHSVLGYRGLTGNPDIPPSRIVAKIMQRFEVNERKKSMGSIEHTI